ncbi:MAG TPA: DNA repair protein RecO [Salinimicrobium sp.]|nr:DNA repair protein RecO [Salinimicrobium sp.]
MLVTTKAIVISAIKFSEADLIVKCFTESDGLKTYLCRNILKSKKSKLKASLFQPLNQLELVANHKNKGAMEYIREAKVASAYQTFHSNIYKSSIVIFLSEILRNTIKEEEQNIELFKFLENRFNWLEAHDSVSNFHIYFLVDYTRFLGFYPNRPKNELSFFNLQEGIFQEEKSGQYCVSGENVDILKQILGTKFDDQQLLKLTHSKRNDFLNLVLLYYDLHLQNLKKPKSLSVLNELFS